MIQVSGGIYEDDARNLVDINGKILVPVEKRTVDECYSRTVGYLRPVSQWNLGKKAEFKDRVMYQIPKNLEERNAEKRP